MKILISFLFVSTFIFSCSRSDQEVFREMKGLEYQRNPVPARFASWLKSENPAIREKAVESLGKIQDTSTISWVAEKLNDADAKVREEAAFAMGQFFSPNAEPPLLNALDFEKNTGVKSRLVEALGKTGTEKSFPFLENLLDSQVPDNEKNAALSWGLISYRGYSYNQGLKNLNELLKSTSDPEIQWRAAYALYRSGSPAEMNTLYEILKNNSPFARYFALKGITSIAGILKSSESEGFNYLESARNANRILQSPDFLQRLKNLSADANLYVKLADLQLMGVLTDPSLWPSAKEAAADENPYIRAAALEAIAGYKNQDAENFLTQCIQNSENWRDRGIALMNLAKINQKKCFEIVNSSIEKSQWPENYYYIKALEQLNSKSSTRLLMKLSDNQNIAQVSLALEALSRRDGVPLAFLINKLKRGDPAITTIVASRLAATKESKTAQVLIDAYENFQASRDIEPMEAIIAALDSIGSTKPVPLLEREMKNPFPAIQRASQHALKHITGKEYPLLDSLAANLTRYDFKLAAKNIRPKIKINTTKGSFVIELFPDKAPVTVANFVQLADSGFYNNIYFHRVVPGFVIQAGDPRGDGWGGPGYTIPCEYNDIFYDRGTVGMATAGKDTGGSQFFVTHTPQPHLNGRYTAFGKVISGMDVVDHIEIFDKILNTERVN